MCAVNTIVADRKPRNVRDVLVARVFFNRIFYHEFVEAAKKRASLVWRKTFFSLMKSNRFETITTLNVVNLPANRFIRRTIA